MNPKIKKFIINFLIFDACSTVFLFATIGVEGMAKLACHVYDDPVCKELEDEDKNTKQRPTTKSRGKDRPIKYKPVKRQKECGRIGGSYQCWEK